MRRLELMGDQGVEIGRLLTDQAKGAAACANSELVPDNVPHAKLLNEIAAVHARVVRAVAIACAIEDRIEKGLPALPELDQARRARDAAVREKREAAADEVETMLIGDSGLNRNRQVHLRLGLHRLLDRETADLDRFLARPLPQLIGRLRRDLGMGLRDEDELWLEARDSHLPEAKHLGEGDREAVEGTARRRRPDNPQAPTPPTAQTEPEHPQPASASPLHHLRRSPAPGSPPRSGEVEKGAAPSIPSAFQAVRAAAPP
jgi:hypothetical protein